jgi:hypothetical protein
MAPWRRYVAASAAAEGQIPRRRMTPVKDMDEPVNIDAEPENTLGGRVNTDMEFEDAMKLMLNTDLRETGDDEA